MRIVRPLRKSVASWATATPAPLRVSTIAASAIRRDIANPRRIDAPPARTLSDPCAVQYAALCNASLPSADDCDQAPLL
jgi:hypothetical protein